MSSRDSPSPEDLAAIEALAWGDPRRFSMFKEIEDQRQRDEERELYESSLLAFFERSWREFEPNPISINWHHERICEELENITFGITRDLIVNIPPRYGKTNLINIVWPSWIWCRHEKLPLSGPQVKFLCVSYGATLAELPALKMLRLVQCDWYKSLWGDHVKILVDQMSRAHFANTKGGERISASIEAGLIGRGGDVQVVDDPHNLEGAESNTQRESTIQAVSEGLPTRVTDPRITARVLVMQRLHTLDATAWCLENWRPDHVHLMYPEEFDPDRACPSDPRKEAKELLWPQFWNAEACQQTNKEMSEYAIAGQKQQMPVPRGGGIIKREWWKCWPELGSDGKFPKGAVANPTYDENGMVIKGRIEFPAFEYVCASVDTALTGKQRNDPWAMTIWGVFRAEGKGRIERRPDGTYERVADDYGYPKAMLLFGWEKHLVFHGVPQEIPYGVSAKEWSGPEYREYRQKEWGGVEWVVDSCKRYKVDHLKIETQAAGFLLESELRLLHSDGDWGIEVEHVQNDKEWRLQAVSHMWANGQIYVPTYEDGTHPSWAEPIVDQISLYPRSKRDDLVDTASSALAHLRSIGLFTRKEEFDAEETHLQEYQRNQPVGLPYDL